MQVIGLCRFSYPAIGGFQVEHETIEDRKAYLWSQTRLEERFRLFETVALPALRQQTDDDFDYLIVIGDDFPKTHEDRLRAMVEDVPQAKILPTPPERMRLVMKDILNNSRNDPKEPCLQFRMDDDDAVTVDFVENLRRAAWDCAGLIDRHRAVAFDWSVGYYATVGPQGIQCSEPLRRPYDTAALGMYVRGGAGTTIMNFNHKKIAQNMPSVAFAGAPMYVRTHNAHNDSRQKPVETFDMTPLSAEREAEFQTRFAISSAHVKRVFGAAS